MLGLRLDEPLSLAGIERGALARVEALGLARADEETIALTDRGRFLGDAVTAELLP